MILFWTINHILNNTAQKEPSRKLVPFSFLPGSLSHIQILLSYRSPKLLSPLLDSAVASELSNKATRSCHWEAGPAPC